jgi:hypothetical protein
MFTILFTIIKKRPDVKDKHDRILERNTRCKRYLSIGDDRDERFQIFQAHSIALDSGASFDIFDEQGYYLYRMDLPFSPEIIHKGNLYDVSTSEETGYVRIKRYAVKGWDRIKTGT